MRRWAGINDEVKVPPTENFLLKWRSHAGCGLTCQPCVSYDAYGVIVSHVLSVMTATPPAVSFQG